VEKYRSLVLSEGETANQKHQ